MDLVVPAVGGGGTDQVMEAILHLAPERIRTNHAKGEFQRVEQRKEVGAGGGGTGGAVTLEAGAEVKPGGVRAVHGKARSRVRVAWRVDVLPNGQTELVIAVSGNQRVEQAGDLLHGVRHRRSDKIAQVGRKEGELEAVCVVFVRAGEVFVVLGVHAHGAKPQPGGLELGLRSLISPAGDDQEGEPAPQRELTCQGRKPVR